MKAKVVFPGQRVAVTEEYIPGEGTYELEGDIYAAQMGELNLDPQERVARVRGFNPPLELRVGDVVLATVKDSRPSMVIVEVEAVEGMERAVTGQTEGTIHISKISDQYTEDVKREMRIGDLVRARVVQVKPSLQLATNEPPLGVVRGLCTRDRWPMVKQGRQLYCERCERTEPRKVSTVYDSVVGWRKG
ncbi:MAG: exosome complex RNA-binding protein Csl4 [Thermoplasmata archaeon]